MSRTLHAKAWRSVFEACDRAAQLLKSAGFELRYTSMKTESCYYGWPGRVETIRVSAHRKAKKADRAKTPNNSVAGITISASMTMYTGGVLMMPDTRLQQLVASAIGNYFLHLGATRPTVESADLSPAQ